RVSAQRDNGARRSSPVKALSLQSDNPEPSPVAAKLPCDGDNVRNGQATLRSRPRKVKIGGEHVYCVQIASDRDGSNSADSGCRSSGQYLPVPAIQKSAKTSRSSLRQLNTGRPRAG